jgi:hypothetical protein
MRSFNSQKEAKKASEVGLMLQEGNEDEKMGIDVGCEYTSLFRVKVIRMVGKNRKLG